METPVQHPDARCGKCEACRHVACTKTIILAHSAPAGPGIGQPEADLWNQTLRVNPCYFPLVLVYHDNHVVKGRILGDVVQSPTHISVNTVEYGQLRVMRTKVRPWTPATSLEGIAYDVLDMHLANLPITWYPQLLATLLRAAKAKGVFTSNGVTDIWQTIQQETPPGN